MSAALVASAATISAAGNHIGGGEAIAFWILGPVSVIGALGMVLARNAIHSALSLVATMMCLGLFYVIEQGPFLGSGPDHRLHRRDHDPVPVRPDAGRT